MIRCTLRLLAVTAALCAFGGNAWGQTDYYWNGADAINNVASWGTAIDGSGPNPTDFTTANQLFNIQNSQSATLGGAWTISGSGSALVLQTGGTFNTGSNNPTLTANIQNGGNYRFTHTTYGNLTLGTLDPGSNFIYAGTSGYSSSRTYGTFVNQSTNTLNMSGSLTTTGDLRQSSLTNELRGAAGSNGNGINIGRDLIVDSSTTLNLVSGTATPTFNIGRNLTNNGTISTTGTGTATFNFNGSGTSTATWGTFGTDTTRVNVAVASGRAVTFADAFVTSPTRVIANEGTLNIGTGSTLSGTGTVSGAGVTSINAGGTLRGGSAATPTGTLNLAATNLAGATGTTGATLAVDLNGATTPTTAAGSNSLLAFGANAFNLDVSAGRVNIRLLNDAALTDGSTYTVNLASGDTFQRNGAAATGGNAFTSANFNLTSGSGTWSFNNVSLAVSGTNLQLTFQVAPVPEPATVLAIGAAGLGLVTWVRRRRKPATV